MMLRELNQSVGFRLAGVCRAGASLRAPIVSLLSKNSFAAMSVRGYFRDFHLGSLLWSFAGVGGSDEDGKPEASALILPEFWVV